MKPNAKSRNRGRKPTQEKLQEGLKPVADGKKANPVEAVKKSNPATKNN